MNVKVEDFGLMMHPTIDFLGASPDGIICRTKLDGIHKTKYVGRMLEIKCPLSRKINMSGPIKDHICPLHYWIQVQLQLECCNLEECDFWQCNIREYPNRTAFIEDTDPNEPFRSLETGYEKGCLIQLIPKKRINETLNGNYWKVVHEESKFLYPPKIEMSPYDCDIWIAQTIELINNDPTYYNYVIDKVLYWKLIQSKNVTIKRDRLWFKNSLPTFERIWNYVLFFRSNQDKLDLLVKYINSKKRKMNKDIMTVIDKMYNTNHKNYNSFIKDIHKSYSVPSKINKHNKNNRYVDSNYGFINSTTTKSTNNKKHTKRLRSTINKKYIKKKLI
jgi:hypothetical protein